MFKFLNLIVTAVLVLFSSSALANYCSEIASKHDFKTLKPKDAKDEDGFIVSAETVPLTTANLMHAYKNGAFPWNSNTTGKTGWYTPIQHGVVPLRDIVGTGGAKEKSLRKVWNKAKNQGWTITFNREFNRVMEECARHPRGEKYQHVWLVDEVKKAFNQLHKEGLAHSVEVWDAEGNLIGGTYGIYRNGIFSAESMFNHRVDGEKMTIIDGAGKVSVVALAQSLYEKGHSYIDTQTVNDNTRSNYNAYGLSRKKYIELAKWEEARLSGKINVKELFSTERWLVGSRLERFEKARLEVEKDLKNFPTSPELTPSYTPEQALRTSVDKTLQMNKLKFDEGISKSFKELISQYLGKELTQEFRVIDNKTSIVKFNQNTVDVFLKKLNLGLRFEIQENLTKNELFDAILSDFKTQTVYGITAKGEEQVFEGNFVPNAWFESMLKK